MKTLILTTLIFLLTSCGKSPLLNHGFQKSFAELNDFAPVKTATGEPSNLKFSKFGCYLVLKWIEPPSPMNEGSIEISVVDSVGKPLATEANLSVYNWMPGMGHGSSPIVVSRTSASTFLASEIVFTMGGVWDIHFILSDPVIGTEESIDTYSL